MVIHDWLYYQNKLTREKCDALFMTCCWPLVRITAAPRRCSRGCALADGIGTANAPAV